MKSMYASTHACYSCGATWKKDDEIFKISNGTKDYWCSNPNCRKSKTEAKQETIPQAKDFDQMQNQTLFDDGHTRAIRKLALLRGVRKALGNESEPVIGMIFNQICADLRL